VDKLPECHQALAGHKAVFVLPNHREKTRHLSLRNPYLDADDVAHPIVQDPNDYRCVYNLLVWWMKNALPLNYKGLLFLRIAPKKILKSRRVSGVNTLVDDRAVPDKKNPAVTKPKGKLGVNWLRDNSKFLARVCDFEGDSDRFSARSPRRSAITKMIIAGVPQKVINMLSRHSQGGAAITNHLYQEASQMMCFFNLAITCLWHRPSNEEMFDAAPNGMFLFLRFLLFIYFLTIFLTYFRLLL
jgi:hypothetical protein